MQWYQSWWRNWLLFTMICAFLNLQVEMFDHRTQQSLRTFRHFKQTAYSGSYRSDGQLIVCGGEEPIVQVFDVTQTKLDLRRAFRGHTSCVYTYPKITCPTRPNVTSYTRDWRLCTQFISDHTFRRWNLSKLNMILLSLQVLLAFVWQIRELLIIC